MFRKGEKRYDKIRTCLFLKWENKTYKWTYMIIKPVNKSMTIKLN